MKRNAGWMNIAASHHSGSSDSPANAIDISPFPPKRSLSCPHDLAPTIPPPTAIALRSMIRPTETPRCPIASASPCRVEKPIANPHASANRTSRHCSGVRGSTTHDRCGVSAPLGVVGVGSDGATGVESAAIWRARARIRASGSAMRMWIATPPAIASDRAMCAGTPRRSVVSRTTEARMPNASPATEPQRLLIAVYRPYVSGVVASLWSEAMLPS